MGRDGRWFIQPEWQKGMGVDLSTVNMMTLVKYGPQHCLCISCVFFGLILPLILLHILHSKERQGNLACIMWLDFVVLIMPSRYEITICVIPIKMCTYPINEKAKSSNGSKGKSVFRLVLNKAVNVSEKQNMKNSYTIVNL